MLAGAAVRRERQKSISHCAVVVHGRRFAPPIFLSSLTSLDKLRQQNDRVLQQPRLVVLLQLPQQLDQDVP